MDKIKFGTDGWRAIIAEHYTVENVKRVAEATALWMKSKNLHSAVIGHDARFGGPLFAQTTACVLGKHGIKIKMAQGVVTTPMVSLGIVKLEADLGIVITASHNPPSYNGYKLKSAYGGPTIPAEIAEVEELIPDTYISEVPSFSSLKEAGMLEFVDLEEIYFQHCVSNFDLEAIRNSHIKLVYDAMYGAGLHIVPRLLPETLLLRCDENPGFKGCPPEPIRRNLGLLSKTLKESEYNLGLANDGDADRIGMYDEDGNFVDSHHLLLLLLYYLAEVKKMSGKVIITFSVTDKMKKLAEHFGLEIEVTKIGFKYIAEIMIKEDVLVGGEESGGLAVKGHIPERDGVWMGLLIMEFMAKSGKSLKALIQDIYDIVGPFAFDRDDLHLTNEKKLAIMEKCKAGEINQIGDQQIIRTENVDGYKFYLNENEWVMIRPSGTEPVLRVYSQAPTLDRVKEILQATHATLG